MRPRTIYVLLYLTVMTVLGVAGGAGIVLVQHLIHSGASRLTYAQTRAYVVISVMMGLVTLGIAVVLAFRMSWRRAMAKPPADADPEKFIIGRGVYDNLQTATPFFDEGVFRLDPTPMPLRSIIIFNAVFAAFFFGFHWATKHYTRGQAGPWALYGAPIGIGLFTCILFTLAVYYSFDKARRLGPWIVFEKATGQVVLPREGVSFERDEIVHLQYVTTKRLDWGGVVNNDRLSELNLITCRGGDRRRRPLLRSIFNVKPFDRLLKPLLEHTDLPVVRVEDEWLGWNVTEKPYGRSAGR